MTGHDTGSLETEEIYVGVERCQDAIGPIVNLEALEAAISKVKELLPPTEV
jgi:hypothetical protein